MEVKIKPFKYLCDTEDFIINGIEADSDDFGEVNDLCPESAEEYGCGDARFVIKEPTTKILSKYGITTEDYYIIADNLENMLSFGCCGLCV